MAVPAMASAEGFYLGANVGSANASIKEAIGEKQDAKFNKGRQLGLNAGYQLTDWFAVEGRLNKSNSVKKDGNELMGSYNVGVYSKFSYYVSDSAYLYGLAGVTSVKYGLKEDGEPKANYKRQTKPSLGVGVGFDITNNLTLSADYMDYAIGKKKRDDLSMSGFNLSVNYRF